MIWAEVARRSNLGGEAAATDVRRVCRKRERPRPTAAVALHAASFAKDLVLLGDRLEVCALCLDKYLRLRELLLLLVRDVLDPSLDLELARAMHLLSFEEVRLRLGELGFLPRCCRSLLREQLRLLLGELRGGIGVE